MAVDSKTVNHALAGYVADVRNTMPIDRAILFGSYAKGTARGDRDIDLCFFSHSFENRRSVDILSQLLGMTHKYRDVYIEPHIFPTSELHNDNPFVKEILQTGKEV
jgi:predicted nucleotidyltransferase